MSDELYIPPNGIAKALTLRKLTRLNVGPKHLGARATSVGKLSAGLAVLKVRSNALLKFS